MQITLNGKPFELLENSSAANLIESLNLSGKKLAMEVNQEILPRNHFETHHLHEGDQVEIVHAIGGG